MPVHLLLSAMISQRHHTHDMTYICAFRFLVSPWWTFRTLDSVPDGPNYKKHNQSYDLLNTYEHEQSNCWDGRHRLDESRKFLWT